jgi:HK97 family phage prohead protease
MVVPVSDLMRLHCEMRAELSGTRKLVGHAAVFRTMADLGSHYESLGDTAFTAVMKDPNDDPRGLFNHDPNMVLGRKRSGTLRYSVDSEGLPFEIDLPDTSYANDLRAVMERRDIDECSFAFFPGASSWLRAPDGKPHERQDSIRRLLDLSVVTYPAYGGTSAMLRTMTFTERPESLRSQLARARHRVNFMKGNGS